MISSFNWQLESSIRLELTNKYVRVGKEEESMTQETTHFKFSVPPRIERSVGVGGLPNFSIFIQYMFTLFFGIIEFIENTTVGCRPNRIICTQLNSTLCFAFSCLFTVVRDLIFSALILPEMLLSNYSRHICVFKYI